MGSDFFSGDKTTKGSTIAAGNISTTVHQFTGSVFITSSAVSLSASNAVSASTFWTPSGELTPGTAANGADTRVQLSDGSSLTSSADFTFDYGTNALSVTGTLYISSSDGIPIRVGEDEDATIIVGEAALGNGGNTGVAYVCHKDKQGPLSAGFQQLANGQVRLNAVSAQAIVFAANGSAKATFNKQAASNLGYFGLGGGGFIPAYPLDVSSSARIGHDSTMTLHVTGAIDQTGSAVTFHISDYNSFIVTGSTILTGSADMPSILQVGAGTRYKDSGDPVLVAGAAGVGIGVSMPSCSLEVAYSAVTGLGNNAMGGERVYFGTGTTHAGALYYLNSQGGWASASADATGSGNNRLLGVAIGTNAANNGMLIRGWVNAATYYTGTFMTGAAVYIQSGTAATGYGYMSGGTPTAADSYARIVGYASTAANVIYFNPGTNWVELS